MQEEASFSVENARDMKTCLSCHSREGLTFKFNKQKDQLALNFAGVLKVSRVRMHLFRWASFKDLTNELEK
jgi:hypothetical protein